MRAYYIRIVCVRNILQSYQIIKTCKLLYKNLSIGYIRDSESVRELASLGAFYYFCNMLETSAHRWKKVARKFTNKYLLAGALFLLWITFIDENSIVNQMQLQNKIARLTKQKEYYREKTEEDKRKISELLGNRDSLEKFAREQYLMKKSNEDIYIIVEE